MKTSGDITSTSKRVDVVTTSASHLDNCCRKTKGGKRECGYNGNGPPQALPAPSASPNEEYYGLENPGRLTEGPVANRDVVAELRLCG